MSATTEQKIPVQLLVVRSNESQTFYENTVGKNVDAFQWKLNTLPFNCTTSSLYKCACDELDKVTSKAKSRQMIILVVEDLDDDSVCPYIPHKNSPLVLQIFHAAENGPDHASISLSSPAGKLHFEIPQQNFSEQILNVFRIMNVDYNSKLVNLNTPPKMILYDPELLHGMLRENQENIEAGKTPIGYVHLGFGLIIIFIAVVIGFLSVDHDPFFDYQIKNANDMVTSKAKSRQMIILVVEDLDDDS
uniref:Uncharacterized protein n=1 Tax=Panagrolaimus sp. ES5 TaxID=591445 RepID=A0AC34FQY9_9BILA